MDSLKYDEPAEYFQSAYNCHRRVERRHHEAREGGSTPRTLGPNGSLSTERKGRRSNHSRMAHAGATRNLSGTLYAFNFRDHPDKGGNVAIVPHTPNASVHPSPRRRLGRPGYRLILAAALVLGGLAPAPAQAASMLDRTLRALEALASHGSARAQYELGLHYEAGKGVGRDERLALALYCRAARQDYAPAAYRAGRMHLAGRGGVAKDADLGRDWLRRAAGLGDDDALAYVSAPSGRVRRAPDRCEPPSVRWGVIHQPPAEISRIVRKLAPDYGLDPELVLAVIAVESGYRVDVVSDKNAMGLMQLIPETAERFGVSKPFDPEQNLRGGMKYLRWLLAYFDGNVPLALAGYNAGEGAVLQYKGIPPYRETRDYVAKVESLYPRRRHPHDPSVTRSAGLSSATEEVVAELSTHASATR